MKDWLMELCGGDFMPHGQCYLWTPTLVWLHAVADSLIALAYFSIPLALVYVVRKRRDLPFPTIFLMFGAFIVACGATHLLEVWTIWNSHYYLTGAVKALTAGISIATAITLFRVLPDAVQLAGPDELRRLNESLEERVRARTADLEAANGRLRAEAEQRRQAESEVTRLNRLLQLRVDELESLLKMLPVGVGIARDASCRDIRVNNELARVLELEPDEAVSMAAERSPLAGGITVLEEGRELGASELPMQRAVRENRAVTRQDLTIRHASGRSLEVLCSAEPLRDAEGRPSGCVATFQDVTELKSALRAGARLAAIVESSEDAVVGGTLDGVVTDWNQAATRIFGYQADEIVGRSLRCLIPADRTHEDERRLADLTTGATPRSNETRRLRKDGELVDVSVMVSPIRDDTGALVGFSEVARDITERRNAERRREELERRLQDAQKQESLGVLAGGVAHDFNNLLTSMLGNASLARLSVPPGSRAVSYLRDVEKSATRAAELCAQMLAYACKGRFVAQPVDINRLVADARRLFGASSGRAVELRWDPGADLPAVVGDLEQLHQVLMNLFFNAAEAIGAGGGTITVRTGPAMVDEARMAEILHPLEMRRGAHVFVEVSDNGCGMDEATLARIFDPFFSTKFIGRGLGLAAVQGIMRGHKGGVDVKSAPGRGSVFTLYLPVGEACA